MVLNRLKQRAAPISSHHGLLCIRLLKSLPTEAVETVLIFSRVRAKQQMNSTKQHIAINIMAPCHELCRL